MVGGWVGIVVIIVFMILVIGKICIFKFMGCWFLGIIVFLKFNLVVFFNFNFNWDIGFICLFKLIFFSKIVWGLIMRLWKLVIIVIVIFKFVVGFFIFKFFIVVI